MSAVSRRKPALHDLAANAERGLFGGEVLVALAVAADDAAPGAVRQLVEPREGVQQETEALFPARSARG